MTTYLGESKAKAVTRSAMWKDVITELKRTGVWGTKPVMVLASAVGGDVPILRRAGLPHRLIVAVDIDKAALRTFSRKYPNVETRCGDVLAILRGEPSAKYAAIYLDFCGEFTLSKVLAMMEARRATDKHGVFACNLMLKRDKPLPKAWVQVWEHYAESWSPQRKQAAIIARAAHPSLNNGRTGDYIKSFNSLNLPKRTTRLHLMQAMLEMFGMQSEPSKLCGTYEYISHNRARMCAFTMTPTTHRTNQALIIPPNFHEFVAPNSGAKPWASQVAVT